MKKERKKMEKKERKKSIGKEKRRRRWRKNGRIGKYKLIKC